MHKANRVFSMLIKERLSYEVDEVGSDVHLEVDEKGKVIGIDIWNAGCLEPLLSKSIKLK